MIKKHADTYVCDLCKEEVPCFAQVSEGFPKAVTRLEIEIYYGGTYRHDICQACSDKIQDFLYKEFPRMSGQKK